MNKEPMRIKMGEFVVRTEDEQDEQDVIVEKYETPVKALFPGKGYPVLTEFQTRQGKAVIKQKDGTYWIEELGRKARKVS